MSEHRSRFSWWRANRWALLALPLVLVLALAGNASRLELSWWDLGFHDGTTAAPGEQVRFVDEYDDGYVQYPVEGEVRLLDVRRTSDVQDGDGGSRPVEVADGGVLWEVRLAFDVDPDIVTRGCQVALVDDTGTRWDAGNALGRRELGDLRRVGTGVLVRAGLTDRAPLPPGGRSAVAGRS